MISTINPRLTMQWKTTAFLAISFLMLQLSSFAQTSKAARLKQQLREARHDTTQLRVLRDLSRVYSAIDPQQKYEYAVRYKELAEKLRIDSVVADAYLDIGISYGIRSQVDSALFYFNKGYKTAQKANYLQGMGRSLANSGFAYDRLDDKQAAIKHYMESLKYFKKVNFVAGINQMYINIGSIYSDLHQHKQAESYFNLALQSYKKLNDEKGVAHAIYTLGNINREKGDLKKAEALYAESLNIRTKLGDLNGIALASLGLGRVQTDQKRYDEAIKNLNVALEKTDALQDVYVGCAVRASMAHAYLGKGDLTKAEQFATVSLQNARSIKSKTAMIEALEELVTIKKAQNDIPAAFAYQSELMQVQEDMAAEKMVKDVTLTEIERIRAENTDLNREFSIASKKNTGYLSTIIVTSAMLILSLVIIVLLYRRNKERTEVNKLLLEQKEEIARANQELARLNQVKNKFFSIVSHDLRAPLANLSMLIGLYREGDLEEDELRDLVTRLEDTIYTTSGFLDNLLAWSKNQLEGIVVRPDAVPLHDLVESNRQLFMPQLKTKDMHINNDLDESDQAYADPNMINVVIRNIISNGIKYCRPGDSITCTAEKQSDKIVLTIADDGPGMSEKALANLFSLEHTMSMGNSHETGHRIGLVLCREMLEQNQGSIEVRSKEGFGSSFIISLPRFNGQV